MTTTFVRDLAHLKKYEKGIVATMGTFDGIHRGHQAIFGRVREASRESHLEAVLITFDPHPRFVVSPHDAPKILTTTLEKERFIPCFFEGQVLILPFTRELMSLTAEEFVRQVLVDGVGARKVIVGYDHAFGKNRSGNVTELKRLAAVYGFEVEVVDPIVVEGKPVSSTRIRVALQEGRFEEAIQLLGHSYAIAGPVERGLGLGRKLGYPTANVAYSPSKQLPPEGVYACWAQVGGEEKNGMMFIGENHFNPARRITVEANLFDFDRDIYDQEIVVYPVQYIRENRRFAELTELVAQIERDKLIIVDILSKGAQKTCQ